jgi:hypothetical protein
MNEIECPYCRAEQEYNGDGLSDDESEEVQCEICEKNFMITACVSVSYDSRKCDCLNGAEHRFQDTRSFPRITYGKIRMKCDYCELVKTREATEREIAEHGNWPDVQPKVITPGPGPV